MKKIAYSPANALTSSYEYTYQPGGNIATWKRNNGLTDTITAYGYDAADQLLTALTAATATPSVTTETLGYSYDRAGNRQSEQRDTVMAGFTFNNLNQALSRNGGGGILVRGNTDEPAQVTVNGKSVTPAADNTFETVVPGTNGANTIAVTAKDFSPSQNTQTKSWSATMSAGTTATYTYDAGEILFSALILIGIIVGVILIFIGIKKSKNSPERMRISDLFDAGPSRKASGPLLVAEGVLAIVGALCVWFAYFFL